MYFATDSTADRLYVAGMEDVLDPYETPYDPKRPVLGMDEPPVQLLKETRLPIAATKEQIRAETQAWQQAINDKHPFSFWTSLGMSQ